MRPAHRAHPMPPAALPFLHHARGVQRVPSMAAGIRLIRVVSRCNEAIRARAAATPGHALERENARVIALCGMVIGATWADPGVVLETPDTLGDWRDLDLDRMGDVEAWGDAVAAECFAAGWTGEQLGAAYNAIALAVHELLDVRAPEVKDAADFSDHPGGPSPGSSSKRKLKSGRSLDRGGKR